MPDGVDREQGCWFGSNFKSNKDVGRLRAWILVLGKEFRKANHMYPLMIPPVPRDLLRQRHQLSLAAVRSQVAGNRRFDVNRLYLPY